MTRQISVELVLIGILGVYGWVLIDRMPHSGADHPRALIEANKRLRFADGTGIDAQGKRVGFAQLPGTKRLVAFLLRHASLTEDLNLWREVGGLLPSGSGVHLVGYCDGSACAEAVRNNGQLDFQVIMYGELIDSQAVLNADMQGDFVLKVKDKPSRTIRWRGAGGPPESAESIVQSVRP